MSDLVKYDVKREHEGDRFYKTGETRELSEADAKRLVDLGVLARAAGDEATKAEPAPKNKAEKPNANKAD